MNDKDLIKLLNSVKDDPAFGGDFDFEAQWQHMSERCGFDPNAQVRSYTFGEYAQYATHRISHGLFKPMAVGLAAFLIAFTGWVTAVNASFDSVPGDYLYPVKLVTEKVQITFAASDQRRAKLHVEFAGRRLQEVTEIENSDRTEKGERTKVAIESFTKEIQYANDALVELKEENSDEVIGLAIVIDQKTDEFEKTIGDSSAASVDETKEALAEALTTVEAANTEAVDAIVNRYEEDAQPVIFDSVQKNFQEAYEDIKTRITMSLGRLAVVQAVLEESDLVDGGGYADRISDARLALTEHDKELSRAMDLFAAGAVRNSFDLLAEADVAVSISEDIITQLEIEISTKLTALGESEAASEELDDEST